MSLPRYLPAITSVGIYFLVVLGGVVRVTESGLGCPDWPLCHGRLVPPPEASAIIEYSHRSLAALVGLLVLGTVVISWRRFSRDIWIVGPATLALGLLILQSGLGAAAVRYELPSNIVTAHLAIALIFLATSLIVTLSVHLRTASVTSRQPRSTSNILTMLVFGSLAVTYGVMLLGAYIGSSGAGLACPDWPLCHDQVLPPRDWFIYANFGHRLLAAVATVIVFATFAYALRRRKRQPDQAVLAGVATALITLQVFVGALNVWLELPDAVVASHLAIGTLIWSILVTMAVLNVLPPLAERARLRTTETPLIQPIGGIS